MRPSLTRRDRQRLARLWVLPVGFVAVLVVGYAYQGRRDATQPPPPVTPLDPDPRVVAARPVPDAGLGPDIGMMLLSGSVRVVEGTLVQNEHFIAVLQGMALPRPAIYAAVAAMEKVFQFKRLRPGSAYEVELAGDGSLMGFTITLSPLESYKVARTKSGYKAEVVEVDSRTEMVGITGEVRTSLWQAVQVAGDNPGLVNVLVDVFAWDVDFNTDTREGDRFAVIIEKTFVENRFYKFGEVLAAAYEGVIAGSHRIIAWKDKKERTGYFDPDGRSVRKAFLKSPLNFTRISSGFSRNRFHPILHRTRAHLGVDYAAPRGTPVRAIGDGRVSFAGWKGGNGKLVTLHHPNGHRSHYAHLSRFARGIKVGRRVEQKQIIAFVGSTGLATGPHLHFGVSRGGSFVNPITLRPIPDKSVSKDRKKAFEHHARPLLAQLAGLMDRSAGLGIDSLR